MDYAQQLHGALGEMQGQMARILASLPAVPAPLVHELRYDRHDALAARRVLPVAEEPRLLVLYNPLAHARTVMASVLVDAPCVRISAWDAPDGGSADALPSQSQLLWTAAGGAREDAFEVLFEVHVAALGVRVMRVAPADAGTPGASWRATTHVYGASGGPRTSDMRGFSVVHEPADGPRQLTLGGAQLRRAGAEAHVDLRTGLLASLRTCDGQAAVQESYLQYSTTSSGAYLFMPQPPQASSLGQTDAGPRTVRVMRGPLAEEAYVSVAGGVLERTMRAVAGQCALLLSLRVDMQPLANRELVLRLATDVRNVNDAWYADLNAFQLHRRATMAKLTVPGNFYPMSSLALLRDADRQLVLHTQQPLGVASLSRGWLEVMLDRRVLSDDNRGLGQGAADNRPNELRFLVDIEPRGARDAAEPDPVAAFASLRTHRRSAELSNPVHVLHGPAAPARASGDAGGAASFLRRDLPDDLHLLSLRMIESQPPRAAMVLQRYGYECPPGAPDPARDAPLPGDLLFNSTYLRPVAITLSSLSLLDRGPAVAPDAALPIVGRNELAALQLDL